MARKLILSGFMSALLLASVIAYSLPAFAQGPDSAGKSQVEYAFGKIPGTDIIVHVAVLVPPGLDKNEVINQALKYQGAKKIEKSEFSLIGGLDWKVLGGGTNQVDIKYWGLNEPNLTPTGSVILSNVMTTWNNVDANFTFTSSGTTDTCPSLVKECPLPADDDGENGFGWLEIKQPHTLGVTYWDLSASEIDIVLSTNKRISWNTDGTNYDVFTVVLHELGHGLGLGHSEVSAAVMYASYHGDMDELHLDDECGVKKLYGTPCPTGGGETDPEPTSCKDQGRNDLEISVTMDVKSKGPWNHLLIPVHVIDAVGDGVSGICVDLDLDREERHWDLLGTTDSSGDIIFKLSKARDTTYTATVVNQDHFVAGSDFSESCLQNNGSLSGNECTWVP